MALTWLALAWLALNWLALNWLVLAVTSGLASRLGRSALGPDPLAGGEVDLDHRVRGDHGTDVAAFGDDAPALGPGPGDDLALQRDQPGADLRHPGHGGDRAGDLLGADGRGHVLAVDPDPRAVGVGTDLDDGLAAAWATAAGSSAGMPRASIHQVSARYMEPVSR